MKKEREEYQQAMRKRKGCMDRTLFRQILARLHPDAGGSADLFEAFRQLEKVLLDEKQSPTDYPPMPTYEELMAWHGQRRRKRTPKAPAKS
jgi:hypothetical protein